MIWMKRYMPIGSSLLFRSYNILCKNCAQVFIGYACIDECGKKKWFTKDDFHQSFPMSVDVWQEIDVDVDEEDKLRLNWHLY